MTGGTKPATLGGAELSSRSAEASSDTEPAIYSRAVLDSLRLMATILIRIISVTFLLRWIARVLSHSIEPR